MPTSADASGAGRGATTTTRGQAREQAKLAARRSGVVVRMVSGVEELRRVIALFDEVWANPGPPPIGLEHLRALTHAGNYVSAAYDADSMVGASVAFFAAPAGHVLHSDITGVHRRIRNRQVGYALKLHQRAWALDRGICEVTWTFDPLLARNAHFNLARLKARAVSYHEDFYGDMLDGINAGQGSDRLRVSWPLTAPEVLSACDRAADGSTTRVAAPGPSSLGVPAILVEVGGQPVQAHVDLRERLVRVAVPDDIEALRSADGGLARAWRMAMRAALGTELAAGSRLVRFERGVGYVLERGMELADDLELGHAPAVS